MNLELEIVIKDVSYADIESSIELSSNYFKTGHHCLQKSYLEWLYLKNPHGRASMAIATFNDEWVGMTALIPVVLKKGDVTQKARYAVNVLSHPAHRNKNIFMKLIKAINAAMSLQGEWLLGHPNRMALPGWKRQKMLFRDRLLPYLLLPNVGLHRGDVRKIRTASELQDINFDQVANRGGWTIDYSADFIKWRYLDSPKKGYEVYSYEAESRLSLFVTRPYIRGLRLVVDWTSDDALRNGHTFLPSLVMLPASAAHRDGLVRLIKLPSTKDIPFFLTTYGPELPNSELLGITLGACDF